MKTVLIAMLCACLFPVCAEVLVGTVDVQKVLVTVKEGDAVKGKLQKAYEKKQGELKGDEEKIRKQQDEYQKQRLVMNEQAKATKEQQLQEEFVKLQKKTMEYQKEIQEMEQKLKTPILDKIREVVEEVSKKAGVEMTFEMSTGPIVYAKNMKDLTDEVIKQYDKKYPAK